MNSVEALIFYAYDLSKIIRPPSSLDTQLMTKESQYDNITALTRTLISIL